MSCTSQLTTSHGAPHESHEPHVTCHTSQFINYELYATHHVTTFSADSAKFGIYGPKNTHTLSQVTAKTPQAWSAFYDSTRLPLKRLEVNIETGSRKHSTNNRVLQWQRVAKLYLRKFRHEEITLNRNAAAALCAITKACKVPRADKHASHSGILKSVSCLPNFA